MVTETRTSRERGSGRDRQGRQRRRQRREETQEGPELFERAVKIRRVSKVVKGGRNLSFSAMMVVGDYNGSVGAALGKAASVPDAVRKGRQNAERAMQNVVIKDGTIPHEVFAKYGSAKVLLLPAAPGTGVIAGGGVRAVVEAAGIQDVLSKTFGGNNSVNTVRAAIKALTMLRDPQVERIRRLGLSATADSSESSSPQDQPDETVAEMSDTTESASEDQGQKMIAETEQESTDVDAPDGEQNS